MISICSGWEFTPKWTDEFMSGACSYENVRIPHNVKELPLHYALPEDYEMLCGYRKILRIDEELRGKRLFLQFDGAAHIATVYINGKETVTHKNGYTMFRVEITELINFGEDNIVAVKLDTTENPAIPPFGFVIDYLTYGGIYREVWLDVREQSYISDVYVTTPSLDSAKVKVTVNGKGEKLMVSVYDGEILVSKGIGSGEFLLDCHDVTAWSIESPKLYTLRAELFENGCIIDTVDTVFGFRTIEFKENSFLLNGKNIFIRGLNRHQSLPYVGYAVPEHLQREDARILKEELGCNAVRTSHYPQSQYFIDECDRLGLLVFTEIPGWQHIGGDEWKNQAVENTREMIMQYRNHPSIILWGVRINESQDDDEFYKRTNALAHELDPSRPTSGVRYLEKSHLLEDVYAFNDFSHDGTTPGSKAKSKVTPDMNKALLISECNGHMFPTKSYDTWERRQEQALRHARVQNAAMADGGHIGCFGWCMFDYPTHKDFGSGDRICYHGVMDAFRNPKLAAALYASQSDDSAVLEVGCPMDIGDYPAGQIGSIYAFTNADEVRLYKNGIFVAAFKAHDWDGLKHGPVLIDDTIGELLISQEGYSEKKAADLHACLNSAAKYGLANMPIGDKLKMGAAMVKYKMKFEDGYALYGKYVGNWGGEATKWRFDAVKDSKIIATQTKCPGSRLHIEAVTSKTELFEGDVYDMAAVRIAVKDENSNIASYAQLPIKLVLTGDAELVGPDTVTAEGGLCGTYIRTAGKTGKAQLTIHCPGTEDVVIDYIIK